MPTTKILTDRYNYNEAIEEQRSLWLFSLLEQIGLDLEILQEAPDDVITDYLFENQIEVLDYQDLGAIKVYSSKEVVAEWAGPDFLMKKDSDTGEFYYEVSIEHWSVFDDEDDDE